MVKRREAAIAAENEPLGTAGGGAGTAAVNPALPELPIIAHEVDLAGRAASVASVAGKRRSVVPPALRRSRGNRQALAQCM